MIFKFHEGQLVDMAHLLQTLTILMTTLHVTIQGKPLGGGLGKGTLCKSNECLITYDWLK
jgi:hypothetical protein